MVKAGFARVQLLDFDFVTGRDISSVDVELGEDERVSNCRVSLEFKDLTVASKLIELSLARGGIGIPAGLLASVQAATSGGGGTVTTDGVTPGATPAVTGSGVDGASANGVPLSNAPEGTQGDELAKYIVQYCVAAGVGDRSHQAYILATAQHESVMGVYTSEIGGESATYAPWYGRGLVQITWESNYKKFEEWIGDDFTSGEEARNRVSSLKYAIPILVCGMSGVQNAPNFTGVVLSDYGEGDSFDANEARRTVNGTDKASLIAGYYNEWLGKLDSLYSAKAYAGLDGYAYGPLDLLGGIAESVTTGITDAVDAVRGAVGDTISTIGRLVNGNSQPPSRVLPRRSASPNPVPITRLPSQVITAPIDPRSLIPSTEPIAPAVPISEGSGTGNLPTGSPGSESPEGETEADGETTGETTPTPAATPVTTAAPTYQGTVMTVTLGMWGEFNDARLFQFIYTAMDASLVPPYTVSLVGRSIRWNISEGRLPGESGGPTIIPGVSAPVTTPDLVTPDLAGDISEAIGDGINPEDVTPGAGGIVDQITGAGNNLPPGTPSTVTGGASGVVRSITNQQQFTAYNLGRLTTLENVTLEEVAQRVAFQSGVNVRVAQRAKQFRYAYVKFDQKNPLKTLVKLAKDAGFSVRDSSNYPRLAYAPGDGTSQVITSPIDIRSLIPSTERIGDAGSLAEISGTGTGISSEITLGDGEILIEDESETASAGVEAESGENEQVTNPGRLAPQITFRIGRSQVTNLQISDQADADRVVTGDLGQAVTIGVPEDSAKIDVESGELLPPDSIPVGLGDEVSPGVGSTTLADQATGGVGGVVGAFSFFQVDSVGLQRATEISGGGFLGQTSFESQVLGYDPIPGAGSVVDDILRRVNPTGGQTVGSQVSQGVDSIVRAINQGNRRPIVGSQVSPEASTLPENIPGVGNPIIPGVTPGAGGVVAPNPDGEESDPNTPDSEDVTAPDDGTATPEAAPTPAPTASPLPEVTEIPNHTSIGRGYPTTTRVLASSVTIALKPGDFVELVEGFVPTPFNRRWRIDRVRHSIGSDGFWTDIFFYLPVRIQRRSASTTSTGGATTGTGAGTATPPGGAQGTVGDAAALENMTSLTFTNPNPTGTTTSPMGPRTAPTAGASSNHRGIDIAAGQGTPLLACAAGTVVDIGGVSGYGPSCVTLYHGSVTGSDGQYFIGSMYGHGSGHSVAVGDFVQQGQEIVLEDTLGVSTGSHLHWNVYASKTWKPEVGAPYPSDVTVFVDGIANFLDKAWTSDGNIGGHRFTS